MLRAALTVGIVLLATLQLAAQPGRGEDDLLVTVGGTPLSGDAPLFLNASVGARPATVGDPCSAPGACFETPVTITVPDGFWARVHGGLELTAHARSGSVQLTLLDAHGDVVATGALSGVGGKLIPSAATAGIESVALVRDVPSGAYTLRVTSNTAPTSFIVVAQRDARAQQPAEDLLPDLTVLPITGVSTTIAATKLPLSCRPLEVAEAPTTTAAAGPPTRCLRFDTTVANVGTGRLHLTIPQADAYAGTALGNARFTQVVERSDYTTRTIPAGGAVYHAGHDHYHIASFVENRLYAYDITNHTQGAQVRDGQKEGFCPLDNGLVALGMPNTEEPRASACQVNGGDLVIRLEANWWDQYPAALDDQYVDITGLAPGYYELVTHVNPTGVVLESNRANNEASLVVEITASGARVV